MVAGKEELRKKLRDKRKALYKGLREEYSEKINARLRGIISNFRKILLFFPTDGEPNLVPLIEELLGQREIYLPKIEGNRLSACRLTDMSLLKRGKYGIMEPEPCERVNPRDLELVVVPGIAFDRQGYRLGFGKGFYDKFLSNTVALKVGVLYSFQLVEFVPRDTWDIPMDVLITEEGTLYIKGGKLWKS